jgi:hypothetical protein
VLPHARLLLQHTRLPDHAFRGIQLINTRAR